MQFGPGTVGLWQDKLGQLEKIAEAKMAQIAADQGTVRRPQGLEFRAHGVESWSYGNALAEQRPRRLEPGRITVTWDPTPVAPPRPYRSYNILVRKPGGVLLDPVDPQGGARTLDGLIVTVPATAQTAEKVAAWVIRELPSNRPDEPAVAEHWVVTKDWVFKEHHEQPPPAAAHNPLQISRWSAAGDLVDLAGKLRSGRGVAYFHLGPEIP
ncbi:MAG: hypothetical protein R3F39_11840 [Myxococcota bacterium]